MTKVLTIIAHPDDETMLSGGALALLARAGAEVHYLCATRGEGGEVGEPPVSTRQQLGAVREQEMRCAVDNLGGAGVDFLDYIEEVWTDMRPLSLRKKMDKDRRKGFK